MSLSIICGLWVRGSTFLVAVMNPQVVPNVGARILEDPLVHLRQVLLAELDDLAVNVDHDPAPDAGVAKDLAKGGPLAAADDQARLGRVIAGQHARVNQRLVVDEVFRLAGLDPAVEHQQLAVGGGFHDLRVLELGLQLDNGPLDGVHMALDRGRGLEEPLVGLGADQLTATGLLTIGTAEFRNIPRWTSTTEVRSAPNCSTR